jgi:molybdate transport system regulatory protein
MNKNLEKIFSPKLKIWLEANGSILFGSGRVALFEAIEETGSIRQAAAKLGMSYRAAWGKIKATEDRLGLQLVEKYAGGHQSGSHLTDFARQLLACYKNFESDSYAALETLFQQHFSMLLSKEIKS